MRRVGRRSIQGTLLTLVVLALAAGLSALLVGSDDEQRPRRGDGQAPRARVAEAVDPGAWPDEPEADPFELEEALPAEANSAEAGADAGSTDADAPVRDPDRPEDEAPARTVRVNGLVLRPDGSPAEGSRVQLFGRRRRGRGRGQSGGEVRTDVTGRFTLEVTPGTYWAFAGAVHPDDADAPRRRVEVTGADPQELEPFVLQLATALTGVVRTEDGQPVAGARVIARAPRRGRGREATSDDRGRFRVEQLVEGLYALEVSAEGFVRQRLEGIPVTGVAEGSVAVVLQPAGGLRGLVRGPDGRPVAEALVFTYRGAERTSMVRADADGRFELAALEGGPVELFVRSQDFELTARARAEVTPGASLPFDVLLRPAARIEGVLRSPADEPRPELSVEASLIGGDVRREATSKEDGRYAIGRLYPGRYAVTVRGQSLRGGGVALVEAEVDVRAGTTPLDLVVPTGVPVRGRIETPDGEGTRGSVHVIAAGRYAAQVTTDEEGAFALPELPTGSYSVFVRANADRWVGRTTLVLQPGRTVEDLVLQVHPPLTVRGRVTYDGEPVAGVLLRAEAPDAPVRRADTSDDTGAFELGPLYPGVYRLLVDPGSLQLVGARLGVSLTAAPQTVEIQPGAEPSVEVTLIQGG